jgi:nucleotide-binding universal stress UspA family protein
VAQVNPVARLARVAEGTGSTGIEATDPEVEHLRRWLEAGVLRAPEIDQVQLGVAYGLPSIEICRYADEHGADLVVLGRKRHSDRMRILLGDTADAVARRNRCASLFVPQLKRINRILVAVDTSARGFRVLEAACDFALLSGASLQAITVEREAGDEPPHPVSSPPLSASVSLQERVQEVLTRKALPDAPLIIRRGEVVRCVIGEAVESESDLLVVGYHRGGPPGVLEAGSTGRRLVHTAPCAVLTIPL